MHVHKNGQPDLWCGCLLKRTLAERMNNKEASSPASHTAGWGPDSITKQLDCCLLRLVFYGGKPPGYCSLNLNPV